MSLHSPSLKVLGMAQHSVPAGMSVIAVVFYFLLCPLSVVPGMLLLLVGMTLYHFLYKYNFLNKQLVASCTFVFLVWNDIPLNHIFAVKARGRL